ncbi:MAG: M48 family metallopeptidase [Deltaproteobacteria bacterium]|nr:M48 family metallopeptidase [Deltaproteobacteria bacterium]
MTQVDLNFEAYIQERKGAEKGRGHGGAAYSYAGDQKVLQALGKITPVKLAAEAAVRLWKNVARSQILGSAVKVTEKQFSEIHQTTVDCARRLQIPVPTVYIAPEVGALNAHTFGTTDDAYIILNGVLVDHLDADELRFVIGHECGHIHNEHVVYTTSLYYLLYSANVFLRWIVQPAILALQSWSRRAEISCDRAGLLCCQDRDTANAALIKLALGSKKLAQEIDVSEYLKQLDESQQGAGKLLELFQSHPYLPKRVAALELFAQTHYFLQASGKLETASSESLEWCDARVGRILSIFGKAHKASKEADQAEAAKGDAETSKDDAEGSEDGTAKTEEG